MAARNQGSPLLVDAENAAPVLGPVTRTVCAGGVSEPVRTENITDGGEKPNKLEFETLNATGTVTLLFCPVIRIWPVYLPWLRFAELALTVSLPGVVPPDGVTVSQCGPAPSRASAVNATGSPLLWTAKVNGESPGPMKATVCGAVESNAAVL